MEIVGLILLLLVLGVIARLVRSARRLVFGIIGMIIALGLLVFLDTSWLGGR